MISCTLHPGIFLRYDLSPAYAPNVIHPKFSLFLFRLCLLLPLALLTPLCLLTLPIFLPTTTYPNLLPILPQNLFLHRTHHLMSLPLPPFLTSSVAYNLGL